MPAHLGVAMGISVTPHPPGRLRVGSWVQISACPLPGSHLAF